MLLTLLLQTTAVSGAPAPVIVDADERKLSILIRLGLKQSRKYAHHLVHLQ